MFTGLDLRNIDTTEHFMGPGFYELMITEINDTEVVKNFEKTGSAIKLILQPMNGKIKIYDMMCYEHINPKTQEIAWKRLAQLCESALGQKCQITDLQIFSQRTCYAELRNEEFNGQNYLKVKRYLTQSEFEKVRNQQVQPPAQKAVQRPAAKTAPQSQQDNGWLSQAPSEDLPF